MRLHAPRLNLYPSALGDTLRQHQDALSALRSIMDRRGALGFKKPKDAAVFGRNRFVIEFPDAARALDVHRSFAELVGKRRARGALKRVRRRR